MDGKPVLDIANSSLQKGEVRDGKQLIAWDCVQECHNRCPIHNSCVYKPKTVGKCQLQVTYLQSLTDMIFSTYRYLNDDMMFKIGMQLVPLYSMLCRQKIVEKSVQSLAYEDAKGVTRIHPIYKEIRETMKSIAGITREIGFSAPPDPNMPPGAGEIQGKPGFGDAGHYNKLLEGADNKRDVIR